MIKAMMKYKYFARDQEILPYFSRPGRTVNHGRLSEIRKALAGVSMPPQVRRYAHQRVASREQVEAFLAQEGRLDPRTGLDRERDELVIKAREAMLLAVQGYNNPTCYFKSEMFIVSACIAWTYLFLAFCQKRGIDIVDRNVRGAQNTNQKQGERYLSLSALMKKVQKLEGEHRPRSLRDAVLTNIAFLLGIRHEIEHRCTGNVDSAITAKLQACAFNFNEAIGELFGERCKFERDLGLAIQFRGFDPVQKRQIAQATDLPKAIETFNLAFETNLAPEILNDPAYAFRVAIVLRESDGPGRPDFVFKSVENETEGKSAGVVVFKDTEKPKYLPSEVVKILQREGFKRFTIKNHTDLWKEMNAKDKKKKYGTTVCGNWYWYDTWIDFVRKHCEEAGDRFR